MGFEEGASARLLILGHRSAVEPALRRALTAPRCRGRNGAKSTVRKSGEMMPLN